MKKTVLISGTSSGFGKAIADHLVRAGFNVIGTTRKPSEGDLAFRTLTLDVDDDRSVQEAVGGLINEGYSIDVLINNAGFGIFGSVEETSLEEAKAQLETNFFGAVRMIQAVLPQMRQNGGGMIINISSLGGLMGLPFQGFYAASKFALEGLTESLRMEVRPFNIKVMNINPADFRTSFTDKRKFIKGFSDVYKKQQTITQQIVEEGERKGADPGELGFLVERLINKSEGHKIRYYAGKTSQTVVVALRRIFGADILELILRNAFKIK